MNLKETRLRVNELLQRKRMYDELAVKEDETLKKVSSDLENSLQAQSILQNVAQTLQQQAHLKIASIVTRCLSAVFGKDAYEFVIRFEQKRGKTEAKILFVRDGNEISPESGAGGGVLDVAAFALRLACLLLTRPQPRRLIVMDEPMKFVHSSHYRENVRSLLETLADEMDFQFIISTGIEDLQMGTIIQI